MHSESRDNSYQTILIGQSPWLETGEVPSLLAPPVQRPLATLLHRSITRTDLRRFQMILGPRRVGKTTVMYQVAAALLASGIDRERLRWIRLDHPTLMLRSLGDLFRDWCLLPGATLERPTFVFLDELAYAERWDLWLKTAYDERWPVQIMGSSSSTAALRNRRSESGVGRWEEQYLGPYLFTEYLELRHRRPKVSAESTLAATLSAIIAARLAPASFAAERRRLLLIGGFPELLNAQPSEDELTDLVRAQHVVRSDAVVTALYKDIPQAFNVADPIRLERLLYVLAGQMAGLLSPQSIGADLQISVPTIENYLSYLQHAFLIFTLPNYAPAEETIQRRGRKVYFVDGAVRNAALQRGPAPLNDSGEMGRLLENAIAAHLYSLSQQSGMRLYHWRDGRTEVDLIYDEHEAPLALEIAASPRHSAAGLKALINRFPRFRGRCYLVAPEAVSIDAASTESGIGRLTVDELLIAAGLQAHRALQSRLQP